MNILHLLPLKNTGISFASIFCRSDAGFLLEYLCEIFRIGKLQALGNLFHFPVFVQQKDLGPVHLDFLDKVDH